MPQEQLDELRLETETLMPACHASTMIAVLCESSDLLPLFETDALTSWLEGLLAARIQNRTGPGRKVAFRDINVPLTIIATDVKTGIKPFSQRHSPGESVAEAVAASASIPFFFMPKEFEETSLVDGGLLSNFPAWVFDEERRQVGPVVPTFGFDLVTVGKRGTLPLFSFAKSLFEVLLDGDRQLEVRAVENLHIIPLRVATSTLDLEITPEQKDALYRDGLQEARNFFLREVGPRDPVHMSKVLKALHSQMLTALGKVGSHLRVNVILKTNHGRLRVLYTYNMDDDPDDRLELEFGGGASGRCWKDADFVICDLRDARSTYGQKWYMNKYQQALVRPTLRSLLCVPIFDQSKYDKTKPKKQNPIMGILNFDTDEDLLEHFARTDVQQAAAECASLISDELNS